MNQLSLKATVFVGVLLIGWMAGPAWGSTILSQASPSPSPPSFTPGGENPGSIGSATMKSRSGVPCGPAISPSTEFTIGGNGYDPGTTVTAFLAIGSREIPLQTGEATEQGSVDLEITIPEEHIAEDPGPIPFRLVLLRGEGPENNIGERLLTTLINVSGRDCPQGSDSKWISAVLLCSGGVILMLAGGVIRRRARQTRGTSGTSTSGDVASTQTSEQVLVVVAGAALLAVLIGGIGLFSAGEEDEDSYCDVASRMRDKMNTVQKAATQVETKEYAEMEEAAPDRVKDDLAIIREDIDKALGDYYQQEEGREWSDAYSTWHQHLIDECLTYPFDE